MYLKKISSILISTGLVFLVLSSCSSPAIQTSEPEDVSPTSPTPDSDTPSTTPDLATSINDIMGTWYASGEDAMYHRFNSDGSCYVAITKEEIDAEPNIECTCTFEGTQMTMECFKFVGLPPCQGDAVYEVQLLPGGNIEFVRVKDSCRPRIRTMTMEYNLVP